jgi:hypothetical protein
MPEIPNSKSKIPNNFQSPESETEKVMRGFGNLEIGNWDLFGIWKLGFGISSWH